MGDAEFALKICEMALPSTVQLGAWISMPENAAMKLTVSRRYVELLVDTVSFSKCIECLEAEFSRRLDHLMKLPWLSLICQLLRLPL